MSEQPTSTNAASETESQLSAFVDDELTRDEAQFLTHRLSSDSALQRRLRQYHLIGTVARGERRVAETLEGRVRAELATLPSIDRAAGLADDQPQRDRPWRRIAGGGAIAAGVAMLSLFSLNQSVDNDNTSVVGTTTAAPTRAYTVPEYEQDSAAQPQISLREPQLVNYMLRHGQIATPLMIESDLPGDPAADVTEESENDVDEIVTDR
ncbi:MAG: sigma-E factor negative regulatory protein [Pseudomonadota bacterium]